MLYTYKGLYANYISVKLKEKKSKLQERQKNE